MSGQWIRLPPLKEANADAAWVFMQWATSADLTAANLTDAVVTPAQLATTKLCRTTMPDGTVANPDC